MKETSFINKLYIFTAVIDGQEQILVGADKIPMIFLSKELVKEHKIVEQMQIWANKSNMTIIQREFKLHSTLDVIEPMKTEITQ